MRAVPTAPASLLDPAGDEILISLITRRIKESSGIEEEQGRTGAFRGFVMSIADLDLLHAVETALFLCALIMSPQEICDGVGFC